MAFAQYSQDYDEKFPISQFGYILPTGQVSTWDLIVQPYIKSTQVFQCPSDATTPVNVPGFGSSMVRSYGIARYMWEDAVQPSGTGEGDQRVAGRAIASIPSASRTIVLADARSCNGGPGNANAGKIDWRGCNEMLQTDSFAPSSGGGHYWEGGVPSTADGVHLGTDNVLYFDGHVKALKTAKNNIVLDRSGGGHYPVGNGYTWINVSGDLPQN